ncbi:hypothetical protein [Tenacibaculum sp. nBUS_03]|uniref:hypothetical protein n=1 Tax=Tenacibaculum sp. nBUS_03 TaxID=3395320 RepID=UPI003EBA2866
MNTDYFDIKIIDTHENNRELRLEDTQMSSPKLVYNGTDDKLQNLMTAELHFNMLVPDSENATFWHLFTGSETRYKVLLESEENGEVTTVFTGFLLPEQFAEPYDSGGFFVEFVATDGIGRLKGLDFLGTTSKKQSVIEVLLRCLILTGLDLPLNFAPAFTNAAFDFNYKELEVDTVCYKDMTVYEVMLACLESLGCKLVQVNSQWYVLGLNRFSEQEITFHRYSYSGFYFQYLGDQKEARRKVTGRFLSKPFLTVKQPTAKVEVKWESENTKWLLPEDLVTAFPENFHADHTDNSMRYLKQLKSDDRFRAYTVCVYVNDAINTSGLYSYIKGFSIYENRSQTLIGPYVQLLSFKNEAVTQTNQESFIAKEDLADNYLTLKEYVFVYGGVEKENKGSFFVDFGVAFNGYSVTADEIKSLIESGEVKKLVHIAIYYKEHLTQGKSSEQMVYSTLDDTLPGSLFDFDFEASGYLKCVLKVDSFLFEKDGFYTVRLYPVLEHPKLSAKVALHKLHLKTEKEKNEFYCVKNAEDFTLVYKKSVFHGTSRMNLSERRFYFSKEIQRLMDAGELMVREQVLRKRYHRVKEFYNAGELWYRNAEIGIFKNDQQLILNGYSLYRKVASDFEEIPKDKYTVEDQGDFSVIKQVSFGSVAPSWFLSDENEQLYIAPKASAGEVNYLNYWMDKFVVLGAKNTEVSALGGGLSSMYAWLTSKPFLCLQGTLTRLLNPLYLFQFNYVAQKDLYVTNLTLDLSEGLSEVTLIECNDYQEVPSEIIDTTIPVTLNPSINIGVVAVAPQLFNPWSINVSYEFTDFTVVDAVVKFLHFTDHPANGGVTSGLEFSKNINDLKGDYTLSFPYAMTSQERGYYEVFVKQGDVFSNKEVVLVNPVVDGSIAIQKTSIEGRVLSFTAEFQGNLPTPLHLVYQELEQWTGVIKGLPVYQEVQQKQEYQIRLEQGDNFRVWLQAGEIGSNQITQSFHL